MSINNGAIDGESDSHTVILLVENDLKGSVGSVRGKSGFRVLHRQTYTIVFVSFGSEVQSVSMKQRGEHFLAGEPIPKYRQYHRPIVHLPSFCSDLSRREVRAVCRWGSF